MTDRESFHLGVTPSLGLRSYCDRFCCNVLVYFPTVTERRKCPDYLGSLQGFWPIRVTEAGGRSCKKPLRIECFK